MKLINLNTDRYFITRSKKDNRLYLKVTLHEKTFYFKVDFIGLSRQHDEIVGAFEVFYYDDPTMTDDAIIHADTYYVPEKNDCLHLIAPFQTIPSTLFGFELYIEKILNPEEIVLRIVPLNSAQETRIFRGEIHERYRCGVHDDDLSNNMERLTS